MSTRQILLMALAASCATALGCSNETESEPEPSEDMGGATGGLTFVPCGDRSEPFEQGMSKQGELFEVTWLSADPPLPQQRQDHDWTFGITDLEGNAVEGLREAQQACVERADPSELCPVEVDPQMPDHGHGTGRVLIQPMEQPGEFLAPSVYLQMAGYWTVDLNIELEDQVDSVRFKICVPQ